MVFLVSNVREQGPVACGLAIGKVIGHLIRWLYGKKDDPFVVAKRQSAEI